MKFSLVLNTQYRPQVEQDTMAWIDPKERMLPHNTAPPKANKVRDSVDGEAFEGRSTQKCVNAAAGQHATMSIEIASRKIAEGVT